MTPTVLVTDSTADLPGGTGVSVVPAHVAFGDGNFSDAEMSPSEFYRRLRSSDETPYLSCPNEDEYRAAFEKALTEGDSVLCLVTPFDMIPSFTSANAAAVTLRPATVKIVNPGVPSAGLAALLLSLHEGVKAGWELARLIDAVDELAPASDSMFVPASLDWLDRNGRVKLIEERLGEVGDGLIVVRAGTRLTGVASPVLLMRSMIVCSPRWAGAPVAAARWWSVSIMPKTLTMRRSSPNKPASAGISSGWKSLS